jgi:hypothetical protein
MARILGGCAGHFLITEHKNKKSACPEDRSGLRDNVLWWETFEYSRSRPHRRRPDVDEPVAAPESTAALRQLYLSAGEEQRLVIKNPLHIVRVPVLNEMFPGAFFVYCVRHPLATMRSMIGGKGKAKNFLRTTRSLGEPNDRLVRAASSWAEANSLYLRHRNQQWILMRYEDVIEDTASTLDQVFSFLRIEDPEGLERASKLPERRDHDYGDIWSRVQENPHRERILALIAEGADRLGYALPPR